MDIIPEELVEETWKEVGGYSASQARSLMHRIGKNHPYILAFVLGATEDLGDDAHELSVYLFTVIYRMYEKAARKIRRVHPEKVESACKQTVDFFGRLENAHKRFLQKAAESLTLPQPFVMRYVLDALFDEPDPEDPIQLTEEETGQLFIALKTVIDLLDTAASEKVPAIR